MRDIWNLKNSELDFSKLLESVSKLQTQLTVQKTLLCTEKLLREHPNDKPLPNQQATRIKHFMKFVFEANLREPAKQKQLRSLDCSALKLCGLSYTVREIIDLPSEVFEFLVENVASFVERSQLSLPLCRDDINKVVLGDFDPEDEEVFRTFLTSKSNSFSLRAVRYLTPRKLTSRYALLYAGVSSKLPPPITQQTLKPRR
jgi:hypothetical protein